MPVPAGTRIGVYQITSAIGAGGMGEVYRARDTKLGREVAVKVLPGIFAADRERLARLEREAKTLAALNHPHIAQIYGFEESGSTAALVMELVEGEDLAGRIARGPVPLGEVLVIARGIADALEAAHEQGIVHRDLKPANIRIRPDGTVKVLDFGLAKAAAAEIASSPTLTGAPTQVGMILGTAAYMAPEQARGRAVDRRADIWAFGCVLYEMLTGRPAFPGETVTDILAAVVQREPDWSQLPRATPRRIRELLERCLQKDARQRLRDIGDAHLEIDAARTEGSDAGMDRSRLPARRLAATLAVAVAALSAGIAGALWWQAAQPAGEQWLPSRLGGSRIAFLPRISPDGRTVAFTALVDGQTQVGVMNPATGDWSLLTHDRSQGPLVHLAWSRDGSRIYFDRHRSHHGDLYAISPLGGEPRLVIENATSPEPLPDGSLLVTRVNVAGRSQLHRFWPDSGRMSALPVVVHSLFTYSLRAFPDGREAAFFGRPLDAPDHRPQLLAVDLSTGATRPLAGWLQDVNPQGILPVGVSADGTEVYVVQLRASSSTVTAVPRDGSGTRRVVLSTTQLIVSIEQSADGRLYMDQVDRSTEHLRFSASGGMPEALATLLPAGRNGALRLADGRTVYGVVVSGRARLVAGRPREELALFVDAPDEARGPMTRISDSELAFLGGTLEEPIVTVASARTGRVVRRLEGTRGRVVTRMAAAADGQTLYFAAGGYIWSIPTADGEARQVCRGEAVTVDPGGRFILVQRHEEDAIHIVRREAGGQETRITLPEGLSAVRDSLWPGALHRDGRLAMAVESLNSWFWRPAIVDLNTGRVQHPSIAYVGDIDTDLAWDGDHILSLARRMEAALWQFTSDR